jgi:translocation and assembly module TamB
MKKPFSAWVAFLFVIIVVSCLMAWLLATNQGAHFVIERVIRSIPAQVQLGSISGKLAGGLEINDIHVRLPSWEFSSRRLYIRWNPFHLLGGWIGMREVLLEDLSMNDLFPEMRSPLNLDWPRTKGFLCWIKTRIKLFHVKGFTYKEAGREIQTIERVQAQLIWYLGELSVRFVLVRGAPGMLEGSASASFTRPKMSINFQVKPDKLTYGLDGFQFRVNLDYDRSLERVSGPITLIGMSGNNEQVKLAGTAGIGKDSIRLDNIEVKEMGRPGIIEGNGSLNVAAPQRPYELNIVLNDVSISKNEAAVTSITGSVAAKGDISGYAGSFSAKNKSKSWQAISLDGKFQGNLHEIKVIGFKGSALGGDLGGMLKVSWSKGVAIGGTLEARNLNPAMITPDWPGMINADFLADLTFSGLDYPAGTLKVNLHRSMVRKRPLTGMVDAHWEKGTFAISRCELRGNGFDISAQGSLREKIDYQAKITDLGGLIPQAGGRFLASGWFRRAKDQWAGVTKVEGSALNVHSLKVESISLQAQINERGDDLVKGRLQARNAVYGPINLGSPGVNVDGTLSSHDFFISLTWPKSNGTIVGQGGYKEGSWQGILSTVEGRDSHAGPFSLARPVTMIVSGKRISATPVVIAGSSGETVEISGDVAPETGIGNFLLRWEKLNLARMNQLLNDVKFEGHTSGSFEGRIADNERLRLNGTTSGTFSMKRGPLLLKASTATRINCDEKGIRISSQVAFQGGGKFEAQFDSNEPASLKKPNSGTVKVVWNDFDLAAVKPVLPKTIDVKGKLSGIMQGKLLADSRFELAGESKLGDSSISLANEGGIITSSAENVGLNFSWTGQELKGNIDVRFPSHGKVKGVFALPIPAKYPVNIQKTGNVELTAHGEIREKGIVSSLFPGFIDESKGQLTFEVKHTGTWESADVRGRLRLENAAAYLPATGTRLKDCSMDATFIQDRIELTSFVAKSGPGKIEGSGIFWLKNFGIHRFKAKLGGERFQAIYLSELQVQTNPDLTIEGEGNKVKIRGTIRIPEALLRDSANKTSVRTSQDVIIVDAPKQEKKPLRAEVDIMANVLLGEKVRVQVQGLDGRMEGSVLLTGVTPEKIHGKGILRIVNGIYNSYGMKLDVTRGNILFNNEPVENAVLDVMAIRTINPGKLEEIKAGVTVTGTLMSPLVKLYSEPSMTETDILSYMVIGRPIRAGGESNQTAMLLKSATAILGGSKTAGIQSQLQQRLGIDTLEVQEGPRSTFTSSRATTSATSSATLDNSLMTVGKYLSPDLYISYGRSLFNDQFLVSARYTLTKQVEIESKTGVATSVDIYYKIEFD